MSRSKMMKQIDDNASMCGFVGRWTIGCLALGLVLLASQAPAETASKEKKLTKMPGVSGKDVMESQPVVYRGRRLLFHSRRPTRSTATPEQLANHPPHTYLYFVDLETGEKMPPFGHGHSFGSAFVRGDEMNVFATKDTKDDWTQDIYRFWSTDLKNWKRELVIAREGDEHLFNTSVCQDDQGFLMTFESNVPLKWCFKFARSKDLSSWTKVDGLVFTGPPERRSAGNPVIRYFKPYYYVIFGYGPIPGHHGWLTAIARSKDLVTWQMSPKNPMLEASEGEGKNNTDADLAEFDGKTHVYYATGDQHSWMELKHAVYPGPMKEFCESYFPEGEKTVEFSTQTTPTAKKLTKTPGVSGNDVMESTPILFKGKDLLLHSRRPGKKLSPDELSPYNPEKIHVSLLRRQKNGRKAPTVWART